MGISNPKLIKAVVCHYELFTDRRTKNNLAYTIGNGDPMFEVCTSCIRSTRVKQEEEADTRIIRKKVGTKSKIPEQGFTSTGDLTIMLFES